MVDVHRRRHLVNLAIISMASYGAVEYSESKAFCGQVCHDVMGPEFVAHQNGLHARVDCVSCHVGPGAGAFLSAKLNGSRQLWLVATGALPPPYSHADRGHARRAIDLRALSRARSVYR